MTWVTVLFSAIAYFTSVQFFLFFFLFFVFFRYARRHVCIISYAPGALIL